MENDILLENDNRAINLELTRRLCKLHAKGYDLDFSMINRNCLKCVQDQEIFFGDRVTVKVVDQIYDFFFNCYKYVHTVDTTCGKKGIMLLEEIYGL